VSVRIADANPSGGGSHAAFARRALEASAVGTGLTYDQVAGDLTQANYSSLRAGKIEFRRLCEQVQYGMLIPMLVRPIADRFHAQGALLGLWGTDVPEGLRVLSAQIVRQASAATLDAIRRGGSATSIVRG
jgi:hypothetical protein